MFDKIKKLVIEKNNEISKNENNADARKLELIDELLKDDQCFYKIDANTALSILAFLGIKEEDLRDVYLELISPKYFKMHENVRILRDK